MSQLILGQSQDDYEEDEEPNAFVAPPPPQEQQFRKRKFDKEDEEEDAMLNEIFDGIFESSAAPLRPQKAIVPEVNPRLSLLPLDVAELPRLGLFHTLDQADEHVHIQDANYHLRRYVHAQGPADAIEWDKLAAGELVATLQTAIRITTSALILNHIQKVDVAQYTILKTLVDQLEQQFRTGLPLFFTRDVRQEFAEDIRDCICAYAIVTQPKPVRVLCLQLNDVVGKSRHFFIDLSAGRARQITQASYTPNVVFAECLRKTPAVEFFRGRNMPIILPYLFRKLDEKERAIEASTCQVELCPKPKKQRIVLDN
jgi:hypothetical protein